MSERPRVVIVGSCFGGLNAAKRLAGGPVDVTVVDRAARVIVDDGPLTPTGQRRA